MNRLKMALLPCVLATMTLLAALLLGTDGVEAAVKVVSQTSSGCGTWNLVSSPNIARGDTTFGGIAAASTNDVWAVGNSDNAVSSIQRTLVEHWNGTKWSLVSSPNANAQNNSLYAVAAASATNAWVVGYFIGKNLSAQTLIEHWNGTGWSIVPSPNPGSSSNNLFGVTVVKSGDAWAVGYSRNGSEAFQTLIEHWNGSGWSIAASPNPGTGAGNDILGGVTVASNSFWAAGLYDTGGNSKALTEQFC